MDIYHGRFLRKRQGLPGILGLGSSSPTAGQATTTAVTPQSKATSSTGGGLIGGLTSIAGGITSLIPSSTGPATTPPLQTFPSTSSTTSSSSSSTTTPTLTSTSSGVAVYTSSAGTSVVYLTSTLSTPSATAAPQKPFSQNPSLEGGVFALVGIAVLVIAFVAITWTLRKRRRDRLERDLAAAVTFDPGATERYERQELEEAMEKHRASESSSGHGHGKGHGYGYGYGIQPAYAPPQPYIGPPDYGRYPPVAYGAPPPDLAMYRSPSPPTMGQSAQGGANLTRKFSDRKPVPPLFPDAAYAPSNARITVPPQLR